MPQTAQQPERRPRDVRATQPGPGPLRDLRVLEIGRGLASAFCARLFADLGADVVKIEPMEGDRTREDGNGIFLALNLRKRIIRADISKDRAHASFVRRLVRGADLVVQDLTPREMARRGTSPDALGEMNPMAVRVCITPFGLTGPHRDFEGADLIAFHTGGVARFLIGQVADPDASPPVRAYGDQAEFVSGMVGACAGMIALYGRSKLGRGSVIDVSMQEAMASMIPAQLAQYALEGRAPSRRRELDGGGTTVCVLPASDGFVAISPREEHQWQAWTAVMGSPDWARDVRFKDKPSRAANWDELYGLMCGWSRRLKKAEIVSAAQAAHVPSFPWGTPSDHLTSAQLRHRGFFQAVDDPSAGPIAVPGTPYGLPADSLPAAAPPATLEPWAIPETWADTVEATALPNRAAGGPPHRLPLEGIRVIDLSWVIAGPACTRYLAAMGAEVIKVEAPGRADPNRAGGLHEVLGQNKLGITLDLKSPRDLETARRIIRQSDLLVENFATGVMDRLRLGDKELRSLRPDLIIVSASGMGRTGPEAGMVAYGTLLQGYTGFSGLNGFPGEPPSIGMAWTDFVCGLAMAFATVAALHDRRRTGRVARIDLSMVETQLMTMPGPILDYVTRGRIAGPMGNRNPKEAPHNAYRCNGNDRWLAVAVFNDSQWRELCEVLSLPLQWRAWDANERRSKEDEIDSAIGAWASSHNDVEAMRKLQERGIPAGASLTVADLYEDPHLARRGFFVRPADRGESSPRGRSPELPSLPWKADPTVPAPVEAPAVGEHTAQVLKRL